MSSLTKQIAIRIPQELAREVDKRKSTSFSAYVVDAIQRKLDADREAEIVASLACLANDPDANDISDFALAQLKVMEHGD